MQEVQLPDQEDSLFTKILSKGKTDEILVLDTEEKKSASP